MSGASIVAFGDVSASGCGRVVFLSAGYQYRVWALVVSIVLTDLQKVVQEIQYLSPESSSPAQVDLGCGCS